MQGIIGDSTSEFHETEDGIHHHDRGMERIVRIAAGVVMILGAAVMLGWLAHYVRITITAPWVFQMQYNTALLVFLSGIGLLAGRSNPTAAAMLGGGIGLIALLTLAEYASGQSFGIDQLLVTDHKHPDHAYPGRMAPNTAIAFTLAGVSFLLFRVKRKHWQGAIIAEICSFLVFALGAIALAGHIQANMAAYSWGSSTQMSIPSAVSFMVLGMGLMALAWHRNNTHVKRMLFWVPFVLCLLVLLVDVALPLGVAAGILYVPFVFCSLWFKQRRIPFVFAAIATILAITAAFFKPPVGMELWVVVLNRAFTICALWLVASLIYLRMGSEAAFKIVTETMVDGLITIDGRGIVQSLNPAAERLFGYDPEEVIGRNVKMLMPEPYHSEHDGYLRNYLTTGRARVIGIGREVTARRKDGSIFPMELGINEMRVGNRRMFVGTIRDISERKQAEQQRREYMLQLEHTNKDLDSFAYVASHDLKSPLRAIDNLSKWISEDLKGLDDENKDRLQKMRGRVQRMEHLLDDILEYSRAGRKIEASVPVEASSLVREVMELLNVPEGFRIVTDQSLEGLIIPRMPLQQVLHNLIGNALKHHDREIGEIRVSAEVNDSDLGFHVIDDGPGIPKEYHGKIFEMFQTLRTRDEVEGSGMGLALIRKIITRAGGEISVKSGEGRGSEFIFTWPIRNQPLQKEAA